MGQGDEPVAIKEPDETGPVDTGERPVAVATEQIVRPPAECRGDGAERAVEEPPDIIDKALPTARRHVARRVVGVEPREPFGPLTGDRAVMLDDCGPLRLRPAPTRGGALGRR